MTEKKFDDLMTIAIENIKNSLENEAEFTVQLLFSSLLSLEEINTRYTHLQALFPLPAPLPQKADKIKPDKTVRKIFSKSKEDTGMIVAEVVFKLALFNEELGETLAPQDKITLQVARDIFEVEEYKSSELRKDFLKHLARFGSFLTDEDLSTKDLCGREDLIPQIGRILMKMRINDVMLVGPAGVGKTAIIQEFARRVKEGDDSIPVGLRGAEIFQITPSQLTVGAVSKPQFISRIEILKEHIEKHPKIILIINPMDALVSKDARRPDTIVIEELIRQLVNTKAPILATMSPGSYLLLESKPEWENIFDVVRVPEPPTDRLIGVLQAQTPYFKRHYVGLEFTEDGLHSVIDHAKRLHPTQCEPRRSVQFLDDLCVRAQTANPIITELTPNSIEKLLSDPKHNLSGRVNINTDELYAELTDQIVGQDHIMMDLASTMTTRMSKWASSERPRGVFLFGGPTGVGKTETAVQLARILSGSANNLIRVDCNTLQPTGHQKTSVIWTLLGVPPGYMGHGEGGLLSKVKEKPNAVILFDEFEKADSAVGKLLLQILDTGLQQDNNGTMLDFRQTFIIFTSNLGCDYQEAPPKLGFSNVSTNKKKLPTVDESQLRGELRLMGYGPEFLARIHNIFLFSALQEKDIALVIDKLVQNLQPFIQDQGYTLVADQNFSKDIAAAYEPRDGVRGVINKVRSNFTRSISENERKDNLKGIQTICLHYKPDAQSNEAVRDDDALHLYLSLQT